MAQNGQYILQRLQLPSWEESFHHNISGNLFRSDVDAVLIVMTVQDDMERKVMHMVTLF